MSEPKAPRLTIRPVRPTDRPDLIALEADPEVMRYLNGGLAVPEESMQDADFHTPRGFEPEVWVAHERVSGRFVGWFALFDDGLIDGLKTAELGYRLARQTWGQGYGTEGGGALLAEAFGAMGFQRVRAQTMAVNRGSRRVLEKLGFVHVETVYPPYRDLIAGSEQGDVIYELRRLVLSP